ncbi:hypothetical protein CTA1_5241 [Colletotrichum tanaceti]|uniref:Uncharacterized protein n=1 Tax=Colletotrichum tanaceti TaxID=1306861 RepID=A0A4U6XRB0_9PEZI|nr:hypothetical protein CTA1_5241 [Colletotrichum tanaceti]
MWPAVYRACLRPTRTFHVPDEQNTSFRTVPFLQAQRPPHAVADLLLVVGAALAPHLGGLDVGGALVVGLGEHAHDGDENFLDGLDGGPALRGVLVVVGVVAGRVEDGDADEAAGVDWGFRVCAD